ncbi:hypothetical protein ACQPYA_16090 [Micromonospora sp. CA-263727]|uniref:hypothetical protein n=1 Tax=Micromonospora sp. CA-263727 TaxID=3239967 RepID=UPI003D927503
MLPVVERACRRCGWCSARLCRAERDLHARRFAREDDVSLDAYFAGKDDIATSVDGLPGLPLPLPPTPPVG